MNSPFFAIQKGHGTEIRRSIAKLARKGPDQRRSDGIPRAQVGLLITRWSFNIGIWVMVINIGKSSPNDLNSG